MSTATHRRDRRTVDSNIQLREARDGSGLEVSGTAIVYSTWTDLGGAMERISPGAATEALRNAPGLLLVHGHDVNAPLARRGKGLTVWEDATGVHFCGSLANTTAGRDIAELIRAGIIEGCSFAFTIGLEDSEYRDDREWFTVRKI